MKRPFLFFAICFVIIFGTGFLRTIPPDSPAVDIKSDISWYQLKKAQELASSGNKKVLIYAMATWCSYCKKMEREVFPRTDVQQVISKYYYPVRVDIESDNVINYNGKEMTEQEFSISMQISATPTYLFINEKGDVLGRQPGFMSADIFKALLSYVGTDAYISIGFDKYYEKEYNPSRN